MNPAHFAAFAPVCPVCREAKSHPLALGTVAKSAGDIILEAVLTCPNCGAEFPVIDGVPIILPNVRHFVAESVLPILARDDLSALLDGVLADCCGPGSAFDVIRQQLSSYAWDHYAEFDPAEPPGDPRPGAVSRLLVRGLNLAGAVTGPALDLGCSVGRTTFDLAAATGGLALGIDMNFAKLRLAATVLRTGVVRYPRRRLGVVYDRREYAVPLPHRERVDFWACDAAALPLPAGRFGTVTSLNVLDSTGDPAGHVRAATAALAPGGRLVVACPYDWAAAATPLESWLGGHSPRGPHGGAAEPLARALIAAGLMLVGEDESVAWQVRMHDRAVVAYRCHVLAAAAAG